MPRRQQLSDPALEAQFRQWYSQWAKRLDLDPDPDNPLHFYDYRAAFLAGAEPEISPADGAYHWASEFKSLDHPNRFIRESGLLTDSTTGKRVPLRSLGIPRKFSSLEEALQAIRSESKQPMP